MEALLRSNAAGSAPTEAQPALSLRELNAGLEKRVPGVGGHSKRVARYAVGIARELDLPRAQAERVRRAAAIHDIGKLEMPAGLVNKPGPLSPDEFAIVRLHAVAGARIAVALGQPELAAIVRHHHERFDGDGYPDGLAGEEIPLGARIVAVADTFDALSSARPYRAAMDPERALGVLADQVGSQFDPAVVAAFRSYYSGPRATLLRALGR